MELQILYGFLATLGFGVLFNVPKKNIIAVGISGAIGWSGYLLVTNIFEAPIAATFIASILIGIIGEVFARKMKTPVTIFVIPAIIPLVPGAASYRTIIAIINKNNEQALNLGLLTVGIALAIASGLIFVLSFSRVIKQKRQM